jgi:hypothetical protein
MGNKSRPSSRNKGGEPNSKNEFRSAIIKKETKYISQMFIQLIFLLFLRFMVIIRGHPS